MVSSMDNTGANEAIFKKNSWWERGSEKTRLKLKGLENDPRFFIRAASVDAARGPSLYTKRNYVRLGSSLTGLKQGQDVWVNVNSLSKRLLIPEDRIREAARKDEEHLKLHREEAGHLKRLIDAQSRVIALMSERELKKDLTDEGKLKMKTTDAILDHYHLFSKYSKKEGYEELKLQSGEWSGITFRTLVEIASVIDNCASVGGLKQGETKIKEIGKKKRKFIFRAVPTNGGKRQIEVRQRDGVVLGKGSEGIVTEELNVTMGVKEAMKRTLPVIEKDAELRQKKEDNQARRLRHEVRQIKRMHERGLGAFVQAQPTVIEAVDEVTAEKLVAFSGPVYTSTESWLQKKKRSQEQRTMFCYQLINADHAMWSKGISHGDIKPANVLITNEGRVIFGDLSDAQDVSERPHPRKLPSWGMYSGHYINIDHRAFQQVKKDYEDPVEKKKASREILSQSPDVIAFNEAKRVYEQDPSSENFKKIQRILQARSVYADGVTMLEVLLNRSAPLDRSPSMIRQLLAEAGYNNHVITLMNRMLDPDPVSRISLDEAHEEWSELFDDLDDMELER